MGGNYEVVFRTRNRKVKPRNITVLVAPPGNHPTQEGIIELGLQKLKRFRPDEDVEKNWYTVTVR